MHGIEPNENFLHNIGDDAFGHVITEQILELAYASAVDELHEHVNHHSTDVRELVF